MSILMLNIFPPMDQYFKQVFFKPRLVNDDFKSLPWTHFFHGIRIKYQFCIIWYVYTSVAGIILISAVCLFKANTPEFQYNLLSSWL